MERTVQPNFRPFLRNAFVIALAAYIFLQNLNSDIERVLFWGEGFSFLLLFCCWRISFAHDIQRKLIFGMYAWIFLISIYAVGITYFLWNDTFVPYFLWRHLAYFYYALFFFGGYKWGPEIIQKLSSYWKGFALLAFILIFITGGSIGTTMLLGFIWLICQKGQTKKWFFYCIPLCLIYMLSGTGNGTAKFVCVVLLCSPVLVYFGRLWTSSALSKLSPSLFRIFLLGVAIFLIVGAYKLTNMIYEIAAAGGTMHVFADDFSFTDSNGVWRILIWSHLFGRFLKYPLGIGLGTPLVDLTLGNFIYLFAKPDDIYTSGAHNFFATFLVRIGIPFLGFFVYMSFFSFRLISGFFKKTQFKVLDTAEKRFAFSSILVFLIGLVEGLFNVVLESPISAGIFWFNFGVFVKVVGDFLATGKPIYEKQ